MSAVPERLTDTVAESVLQEVSNQCGKPTLEIQTTDRFVEDLDMNSLDFIEMVMGIEDALDLQLKDHELDRVKTVENLLTLVQRKAK